MKETVFYLFQEGMHGAPAIPPSEHYYLPKRGKELVRIRFLGVSNDYWSVKELREIPSDATPLERKTNDIDKIIKTYETMEESFRLTGRISESSYHWMKKMKKIPKNISIALKHMEEFQRIFFYECRRVFP